MTTKFIDVTGKTEDEAISKALSQLGLEREDVSVEILERAKKGFLGLGASPARVRITYGLEEEPVKAPPPAPVRPAVAAPASAPAPAPAAPKTPEKHGERSAAPAREEKPRSGGRSPRPERRRGERRIQEERAVEASAPVPVLPPQDLGEPCSDEKAEQIIVFLTGLLQHMGSQAQV